MACTLYRIFRVLMLLLLQNKRTNAANLSQCTAGHGCSACQTCSTGYMSCWQHFPHPEGLSPDSPSACSAVLRQEQGWAGLVGLPGLYHELVQQWWILPGATPSKVMQSTSSNSKMLEDPWRSFWPCRDKGVTPMGFAGAVQPWSGAMHISRISTHCHLERQSAMAARTQAAALEEMRKNG